DRCRAPIPRGERGSMSKEICISTTPHETRLAILEEDQLTEIYFERENEYTLAGSIYKGRVTRVLPGMQSAFVDVGLERDAFLYVTDFLEEQEDQDEFEQVVARAHEDATRNGTQPRAEAPLPAEPVQAVAEEQEIARPAAAEPARGPERDNEGEGGGRWRGRRRRRGRGRGFPESKFASQEQPRPQETASAAPPAYAPPPAYQPIILPGESISKYQRMAAQRPTATAVSTGAAEQAADAAALAASMEPLSDSLEREHQAESRPFSAAAEARGAFGASVAAQERTQQSQTRQPQTLDDAEQERFDQMNVAGVFAGEEAETEREEPGTAFSARTESAHAPDEQHAAAAFQPGSGLIEEEEIEEDEADLPPVEDDLDVADYEELEEETLDRDAPS